jgi:hypothetical protein
MRTTPHKVTLDTIQYNLKKWHLVCAAVTVDETQRKRLCIRANDRMFKVARDYLEDLDSEWETVYEGDDILDAAAAYNRLS